MANYCTLLYVGRGLLPLDWVDHFRVIANVLIRFLYRTVLKCMITVFYEDFGTYD